MIPTLRTQPLIIALVGAARAGKDTIGLHLKRKHDFAKAAFALPLYESLETLYGVSPLEYLDEDKERVIERLGLSVRELLQRLGDHVREVAGDDILIRRLVERVHARGEWGQQHLVITDLRLAKEIDWVRRMGGRIWWVKRTRAAAVRTHATEAIERLMLLHYAKEDAVILNDRDLESLHGYVDQTLSLCLSELEAAQ